MIESKDQSRVIPMETSSSVSRRLPYAIELWDMARTVPERVIGRAAGAVLARAIFQAAQAEHVGRKVVLRRGSRVLAESE